VLSVSLDCLHSVSCPQCCLCLWIVFILCLVPSVACVSGLSSFYVLCLVLSVSLDCLHSVSCAQCCLCLWIVFILCLVPSVVCVSGLSSFCVLCPVLPVSLDCPFLITPLVFSNAYLRMTVIISLLKWIELNSVFAASVLGEINILVKDGNLHEFSFWMTNDYSEQREN
jgi:hypothetical protein